MNDFWTDSVKLCKNKIVLRTHHESINFRAQRLFRARSCSSCRRLLSYGRRSFLFDKKDVYQL